MSNVARSYPTASHVFALAPTAAAEAFDLMLLDPAVASILTPTGPIASHPLNGYSAMRAVPATLRLSGGPRRTLEVILELLPWSNSRSELTIWSKTRPGLFLERSVAAYLQAAYTSLRTLAELLDTEPVLTDGPRHARALPAARDRKKAVAIQD